jgi:ribosome-associated heat shock protein Hsp15
MSSENERIDKFLWSVRLFKTRTNAADACKSKQVLINDLPVKSSRTVTVGDIFKVKQVPIYREFKIIKILNNRVGAKLVAEYIEEITSEAELQKLKFSQENVNLIRDRGTGRPTKKDRRDLSGFFDDK